MPFGSFSALNFEAMGMEVVYQLVPGGQESYFSTLLSSLFLLPVVLLQLPQWVLLGQRRSVTRTWSNWRPDMTSSFSSASLTSTLSIVFPNSKEVCSPWAWSRADITFHLFPERSRGWKQCRKVQGHLTLPMDSSGEAEQHSIFLLHAFFLSGLLFTKAEQGYLGQIIWRPLIHKIDLSQRWPDTMY